LRCVVGWRIWGKHYLEEFKEIWVEETSTGFVYNKNG